MADPSATAAFEIGDEVEVTGHYTWCGSDVHGETGVIVSIETYPAGIVEGGALYMVKRPTFTPMPMLGRDIATRAA